MSSCLAIAANPTAGRRTGQAHLTPSTRFHAFLPKAHKQLESQIQQQQNGTYVQEPEDVVKLRQSRHETKQASIQVYMADAEEDSIIARMQALDAWYDEKTEDIMRNGRLDVSRRRDQLALLEKEYKLRKKHLDDLIDARLAEADGGSIRI